MKIDPVFFFFPLLFDLAWVAGFLWTFFLMRFYVMYGQNCGKILTLSLLLLCVKFERGLLIVQSFLSAVVCWLKFIQFFKH